MGDIIQEMVDPKLSDSTISVYASHYRQYILTNKLLKPSGDGIRTIELEQPELPLPLPIDQIREIWAALPDDFDYKQVKELVPKGPGRTTTTNLLFRIFQTNKEFGCEQYNVAGGKEIRYKKGRK